MKTYAINFLTGLVLFFAPIQGLLVGVGAIIILDTFTGIYKSVKIGGWKSIKSRILSNIISKMLLYEICIILLYPIDKYLLNELLIHLISIQFFATKLTCVILIFIEGVSIKENIEEALKVNIWQLLRNAIKRAKEVKQDINELKQ
jgi:hypothetical protein